MNRARRGWVWGRRAFREVPVAPRAGRPGPASAARQFPLPASLPHLVVAPRAAGAAAGKRRAFAHAVGEELGARVGVCGLKTSSQARSPPPALTHGHGGLGNHPHHSRSRPVDGGWKTAGSGFIEVGRIPKAHPRASPCFCAPTMGATDRSPSIVLARSAASTDAGAPCSDHPCHPRHSHQAATGAARATKATRRTIRKEARCMAAGERGVGEGPRGSACRAVGPGPRPAPPQDPRRPARGRKRHERVRTWSWVKAGRGRAEWGTAAAAVDLAALSPSRRHPLDSLHATTTHRPSPLNTPAHRTARTPPARRTAETRARRPPRRTRPGGRRRKRRGRTTDWPT
jgi:hypothetical protein